MKAQVNFDALGGGAKVIDVEEVSHVFKFGADVVGVDTYTADKDGLYIFLCTCVGSSNSMSVSCDGGLVETQTGDLAKTYVYFMHEGDTFTFTHSASTANSSDVIFVVYRCNGLPTDSAMVTVQDNATATLSLSGQGFIIGWINGGSTTVATGSGTYKKELPLISGDNGNKYCKVYAYVLGEGDSYSLSAPATGPWPRSGVQKYTLFNY